MIMHGFDIREYNMATSKRYALTEKRRGRYTVEWSESTVEAAEEKEIDLPSEVSTEWEVCDCCAGHGTCVDPAIDAYGLTSADFEADPSFREEYISGAYDITCPACDGKRVMAAPLFTKDVETLLAKLEEEDRQGYMERLHEQRMGY